MKLEHQPGVEMGRYPSLSSGLTIWNRYRFGAPLTASKPIPAERPIHCWIFELCPFPPLHPKSASASGSRMVGLFYMAVGRAAHPSTEFCGQLALLLHNWACHGKRFPHIEKPNQQVLLSRSQTLHRTGHLSLSNLVLAVLICNPLVFSWNTLSLVSQTG